MLRPYRFELLAVILVTLGSLFFAVIQHGFEAADEIRQNDAPNVSQPISD